MNSLPRRTVLPYLRLGAGTGWRPLLSMQSLDPGPGGVQLGVPGARPIPWGEPLGSFGGMGLVRGTAISADGELLVADPVRRTVRIHRQPVSGTQQPQLDFVDLWPARELPRPDPAAVSEPVHPPADPYTLLEPVDLAFTSAGDLVIADAAAGRLLVLAWPSAALRAVISLPHWRPVALACDAGQRCYVVDAAAHTLHRFDRRWRRDPDYPHPSVTLNHPWQVATIGVGRSGCGSPGCASGCGRGGGCGCGGEPATAASAPAVVAVLDGDTPVLLDEAGRALAPDTQVPPLQLPALQRGPEGHLSWQDPRYPGYQRLEFGALQVERTGIHAPTGLALLAMGRKVRLPQAGTLRLGPLPGVAPGFSWDRLVVDAELAPGTEILLSTLCSDVELDPAQLDTAAVSWSAPVALRPAAPAELLVPGRGGQYLWIDVELRGTGTLSPLLRRVDVHAPRNSSLNLLSPVYRQDPHSADFLDRFLSYFDTVFAEVEASYRNFSELLDAHTVPAGAPLDWLGSWFGLDFDPSWDTATRRQVITEAMSYATERGTVSGIKRLLRWHTRLPEPWPAVIEHFRIPAGNPLPIGGSPLPDPGAAHQVTIVLPVTSASDTAARNAITDLLSRHLPAHVLFEVRFIRPGVVLGAQSSLAVDTVLAGAPVGRLGTALLGVDTATDPAAHNRQLLPPSARRTPW